MMTFSAISHVDWTPDYYEYYYDYDGPKEDTSNPSTYTENPDWYYEEDGR